MGGDGYFPRGDSMLREVHEERAVGLFYGQRALCIGALKPLNYVGTSLHTRDRRRPFERLSRTALAFEAVYFGSKAEADRVLAGVHAMHGRVSGQLPDDAGPHYPAGSPYSAFHPELMLWTIAVLADSAQWFYERIVRRLSEQEREDLWQDYARLAELFGMGRESAPATYDAFREWYDAQLEGEDLWLTDEARYIGWATAFEIPMAGSRRHAKVVHDAILLSSLPERVCEIYGIRRGLRDRALGFAALRASQAARRATPPSRARGSCAREFQMVAAIERRRIERGERTPQLPAL